VDLYREATLRPRVRGEPGVVGDGDGADDGQSEAVVVVDAGAVESLEGLEEAVDLLPPDPHHAPKHPNQPAKAPRREIGPRIRYSRIRV
jgi:hypothetical protein